MEMKVCNKCGDEKPLTEEFYRLLKNGQCEAFCKVCRSAHNKMYYLKNQEKIDRNSRKRHQETADYRKKQRNEYYEKNKIRLLEKQKEYYRTTGYYQKNKETIKERGRKYSYTEKARLKSIMKFNKRRSLKKKSLSTFTQEQWVECKNHFENKCAYCGIEDRLEQEHFIPLSKDGEYTRGNIIPSCKSCNSRKGDKNFYHWYPQQTFYNEKYEKRILKYLGYEDKQQQISFF